MANVSAARLPKDFSRMDIKDLLGSNADSHQAPERRDSTFDLTASSDPHHTLHPTPSFPLPSSNAGPPILPSPAPSISSAPDYYHRRQSTPFPIKSEHPPASHPAWTREALQAAQWRDYHGYEASAAYSVPPGSTYSPNKRASSLDEHSSKRPKKIKGANQKWDAEEDARIIQLRGEGKKWAEISKRLPGRTEIACRLHFQNYLEKRGQWDEEKKTRLARVYERMRLEMWQPLAKELGVPWRSAEAMHWLLGEREIARRANTVPFALISGANTAGPQGEGNGRIAQANRMHDATIHFDPSDLAALQTGQSANGPISAFPYQHDVTTNGDAGHHARREYEGGNVSPTESNSVQIRNLDPQQSAQRDFPPDEGLRLPGLADLDNGISAYAGHGGRKEAPPHLLPQEPQPTSSSPQSHRSSNVSDASHPSQRLHTLADASIAEKNSLRRNSNESDGSGSGRGSGSSADDGYVQVGRKEIDEASA